MREHSSFELENGNEIVQMLPEDRDVVRIFIRDGDQMIELYESDNSIIALGIFDTLRQNLLGEED